MLDKKLHRLIEPPFEGKRMSNIRHMYMVYVENEGPDEGPVLVGMAATFDAADGILNGVCPDGEGKWACGYVMHMDDKISHRYRAFRIAVPTTEAERARRVQRLYEMCEGKIPISEIERELERSWKSDYGSADDRKK
jgi:hypothetical protein